MSIKLLKIYPMISASGVMLVKKKIQYNNKYYCYCCCYCYYYYYCVVVVVVIVVVTVISCHRPFLAGSFLEPMVIPTDRHQVSDCNSFCIMHDVPSIGVFCSESIESFPGESSKLFVKLLLLFWWLQLLPG